MRHPEVKFPDRLGGGSPDWMASFKCGRRGFAEIGNSEDRTSAVCYSRAMEDIRPAAGIPVGHRRPVVTPRIPDVLLIIGIGRHGPLAVASGSFLPSDPHQNHLGRPRLAVGLIQVSGSQIDGAKVYIRDSYGLIETRKIGPNKDL